MSEAIRKYLLAIIAVCLLTTLVKCVMAEGAPRRMASVLCGILLMLCALSPLLRLSGEDIAQSFWRVQMESESLRTGVEVKNRELVSDIIKEKTRTYILDKAAAMDLTLTVEVEMHDGGAYPYPCAVTLTGTATAAQQKALCRDIEENLAIPAERQAWKER